MKKDLNELKKEYAAQALKKSKREKGLLGLKMS